MNNRSVGLYVHVPFCRKKCIYCDFYSLTDANERTAAYTAAVIRNIRAKAYKYDTVYFGGGTPTLLPAANIADILSSADIESSAEITTEANPETVSQEQLCELRKAGVNRISFGVQTFSDDVLKILGRVHDAAQAKKAIGYAADAGFDNISADLMIGLPAENGLERVQDDIRILHSLGVRHISVYMLKVEQRTPLSENKQLVSLVNDDRSADEYEFAAKILKEYGYDQYEISNFAVKGNECRHNLKYWHCEEYFGTGPAAHSCIGNRRFYVSASLDDFISSPLQKEVTSDDNARTREERLMLAMRLCEPVKFDEFPECRPLAEKYAKHGLTKLCESGFFLTLRGMLVSNTIISDFISQLSGE